MPAAGTSTRQAHARGHAHATMVTKRWAQAHVTFTERLGVKMTSDARASKLSEPKVGRRTPGVPSTSVRPAGLAAYRLRRVVRLLLHTQPICCTWSCASYMTTPFHRTFMRENT
eukprot:7389018-Prymnesium_polylepis.1